jgi:hypothetical protein
MQKTGGSFELTATDLVGYLNCRHLSELDRAVAEGRLAKPKVFDPLLQILWERGAAHEQNYVDHLAQGGLDVVRIDGIGLGEAAVSETLAAMKRGAAVIAQGALAHQGWGGRADILRRVELPSAIGDWREEKGKAPLRSRRPSTEWSAGAICTPDPIATSQQQAAQVPIGY